MNKKTFNRFDPFMPIKVTPNFSNIQNSGEDIGMLEELDAIVLNDSLKFRVPQVNKYFSIIISRKAFGKENGLGEKLLEDFLCSFYDSFELPQNLVFMNEGVFLIENPDILKTIKHLKKYGVKIFASLESLKYFNIDSNEKSIIHATSGDIADKILMSKKLINI